MIVVGPYPTVDFFARLPRAMRPRTLVLIVDDAWSPVEIQRIADWCTGNRCKLKVRYASAEGLVHAKLYLVEWHRRATSSPSRRVIAWGSANASHAGFFRNAEAFSVAQLSRGEAANAVGGWFAMLEAARGKTKKMDVEIGGGVQLALPSFAFSEASPLFSFDAWLQAGMLCHRYQPDPRFGAILVKLKQALPPSEIERLFVDATGEFAVERDVIRFSYVTLSEPTRAAEQWKSKYFAETPYGYWTSRECFTELDRRNTFCAKGESRRLELLNRIARATVAQRNKWAKKFVKRLNRIATRVQRASRRLGVAPHHLFQMDGHRVDANHYENWALRQIRQHATLAADMSFKHRYIRGHAFVRVPAMRADTESFDELARGFCDSVLIATTRAKSPNRLAAVLRNALKEDISGMNSREMLEALRDRWADVQPRLIRYWSEEA
jgi:hypothetical protein